jgi:hypothetical protein
MPLISGPFGYPGIRRDDELLGRKGNFSFEHYQFGNLQSAIVNRKSRSLQLASFIQQPVNFFF